MIIVGSLSTRDEVDEITFIAKMVVVGQRARILAAQSILSQE